MIKNKNSAANYIFPLISFIVVWLFFSGNFYNEDYENYVYAFNLGLDRWDDLRIEPLFAYICHWGQKAGITDFQTFKSIIAFIFMIPYWLILIKLSEKPSLSIFIYIPLFLINIVILRNFMAFAILSVGVLFLCQGGKKNLFIFLFFLLISEGIHNLMFIYLIFLLIEKDYKILNKPVLFFALACIMAIILSNYISESITNLDTSKYSVGQGRGYRVILGIPLLLNYILLKYLYKNSYESSSEYIQKFEKSILKINFLIMAIVCFYTINFSTQRLANNLLLFVSVFIANRLIRRNKKNQLLVPLFICYIIFLWWYLCFQSLGIQFEQIFKFNYFIQDLF